MIDKKLTDTEIKKALELCTSENEKINNKCKECPANKECDDDVFHALEKLALNLINRKDQENESLKAEVEKQKDNYMELLEISSTRADIIAKQKAEIERLQNTLDDVLDRQTTLVERSEKYAKAEAYKEFAEEYKDQIKNYTGIFIDNDFYVSLRAVLNAVDFIKEKLVGEDNG